MSSAFRIVLITFFVAFAHSVVAIENGIRFIETPVHPHYSKPPVPDHDIFATHLFEQFISSDSSTAAIPFTRAGNLILIQARADTLSGNFILDTGAPGLILNMTYFRQYHLVAEKNANEESGGITGSTGDEGSVKISEFSIGPFKYYQTIAERVNLGHIEDSKGVKILGLLGMQLFRRFEMIIDYEKNLLHLHLISKKEGASFKSEMLADTSLYNTFQITFLENKVLTYIEVAGKKLTFLIDTGAETNILDSRLPEKIFDNVTITRRITLAGSGNQKIEALYGDLSNMKMGKHEINNLPVLVTNLERMCRSYEQCLNGMLGFDFLSMHKIGFNFVSRKMYIWK